MTGRVIISIIAILIIGLVLYLSFNPQFGGKMTDELAQDYARSEHWNGKKFENLTETGMNMEMAMMPGLIKEQFSDRDKRAPKDQINFPQPDLQALNKDPEQPKYIWFGHSVGLIQLKGYNFLIDPMFGDDAAPIVPFKTGRYQDDITNVPENLPSIDAVLITHDHYDHLDMGSIQALQSRVDTWYVPLGVGRHLIKWGIPSEQITEFDWWQEQQYKEVKLAFTPSRHFSGRGLFDREKTLWGGWVLQSAEHSIYWSGDGGYGSHFGSIGNKYGPFDWAFMECGQYNENWSEIHMMPEESVQAAIDAQAKNSIAVHWAGFTLALHDWKDPIKRFTAEAEKKGLQVSTPKVGEVVSLNSEQPATAWWEQVQ